MNRKQLEKIFASELSIIKDNTKRELVLNIFESLEIRWWKMPTSTTKKYHHATCNKIYGIIMHIKLTVKYAVTLYDALYVDNKQLENIIVACLLHDVGKKIKYNNYSEYKNHPLVSVEIIKNSIKENMNASPDENDMMLIYDMIKFHMGIFTPTSFSKQIQDYKLSELIVYLADYLASRKIQNKETWIDSQHQRIIDIMYDEN